MTPSGSRRCLLLLALACVTLVPTPSRAADAAAELKAVLDDAWEFQLREEPLLATRVGDRRADDKLTAVAPADYERRAEFLRGILARLARVDRNALSEADRVNYDMF